MSGDARDLYYEATWERRLDACRDALDSITSNADPALHDIERGRAPRVRSIVDDALRLARTAEALEAMAEMKRVYDPSNVPRGADINIKER